MINVEPKPSGLRAIADMLAQEGRPLPAGFARDAAEVWERLEAENVRLRKRLAGYDWNPGPFVLGQKQD